MSPSCFYGGLFRERLAKGLVEHDATGHGQIQTADVRIGDGNPVAMVGEVFQDERRQPFGFFTENQEITGVEVTLQI